MKRLILLIAILLIAPIIAKAQLVGPVVSLTGNVFNEVTRQPVTVFLVVFDESGKRVTATRSNSAENGYYYITGLKPGNKYKIGIKQKDYFAEEFILEIANTDKYQEISKDFLVKPLEKNIALRLSVPPFELNKSKLRYGIELYLNEYISTLKANPTVKIQISCYPDDMENPQENLKLTEERARTLMTYLLTNGIEEGRLQVLGNSKTDTKNPPPSKKAAKGKRYIGPTYFIVTGM